MRIEVLLSTMHQIDKNIIKKCNINSDVVVINQCENNSEDEFKFKEKYRCRWINSRDRGLSNSRNLAMTNAQGDVCLLCDEDVVYKDNYCEIVEKAFKEIPTADVIIFDIDEVGTNEQRDKAKKIYKLSKFKTYGSVHVAFKRECFEKNKIRFNTLFGAGSNMYAMAEDALLFRDFAKKQISVYVYPETISTVYFDNSTWFRGYDEKYFFDTGAYLQCAYPIVGKVLMWYYPMRLYKKSKLKIRMILYYIILGMQGYKKKMGYKDFMEKLNDKRKKS